MLRCLLGLLSFVIILSCFIILSVLAFAEIPENSSSSVISDSELLWLVNRHNTLAADYKPPTLADYKGIKLHVAAYAPFIEMLKVMQSEGITGLQLVSAYRPYSHQRVIFDRRVRELTKQGHDKETAIHLASQSIQLPGSSEHQTGLALDVSVTGQLNQAFAETVAGQWLDTHSHRFGFIIRYPQSKTEITNIIYEPWHLRYVGIPHATIMKEQNFALEEYLSYLEHVKNHVFWGDDDTYYLIVYTYSLPDVMPTFLVDISSVNLKDASAYIMTLRKSCPEPWQYGVHYTICDQK